ncbi:DKNYY domain-containing protein [Rhodobacteraceae bacterium S2214]|nr:DKNYY domain-containing protein [Rhodobacteraceae bacterium S2214]
MSNHSDTPSKSFRRALVIVVLLVVAYVFVWRPLFQNRDAPAQRSGATTGYVVEDGKMAWRPMSGVDKFVFNVLTLGLAANSKTVNGRTLDTADVDSFRVIAGRYGLDHTRVWLEGRQIVGADPATFAVLERGFAHDAFQVWKGGTQVMSLPAGETPTVEIHSDHILSIGEETWFASNPAFALPERPVTEPRHHCRLWFEMNGAIWEGATRLYDLVANEPAEMLDCDTLVSTQFKDGVGTEDLSANAGLLIRQGPAITRLTLLHDVVDIVTLPEPIAQAVFMGRGLNSRNVFLTLAPSGTVYAVRLNDKPVVQNIGVLNALPDKEAMSFRYAFWLNGHYFTVVPEDEVEDRHIIDHGPASRLGAYAVVENEIFYGSRVVARPGNLPVGVGFDDDLLVGNACLSYGWYRSDVPDPNAENYDISRICGAHSQSDFVLYDGLRIHFSPRMISLGMGDTRPDLPMFDIGSMVIENLSDEPYFLTPEFLAGFDLRISDTSIEPADDAWPDTGVLLAPDETHSWPLRVQVIGDPFMWEWQLHMIHNAKRKAIFGDEPFHVGDGRFP